MARYDTVNIDDPKEMLELAQAVFIDRACTYDERTTAALLSIAVTLDRIADIMERHDK